MASDKESGSQDPEKTYDQRRAEHNLRRYGIDPNSPRYAHELQTPQKGVGLVVLMVAAAAAYAVGRCISEEANHSPTENSPLEAPGEAGEEQ